LITLTAEGMKRADSVVRRHRALRDFFVKVLSVGVEESEEAACKMEHGVSPNILKRFSEFIGFIERCPRMNIQWTEGRGYHCEHGDLVLNCEECISLCMNDIKVGKEKTECN
jgi:DtxR family transcriptional regulator, Mn-dependent transcriptional regulator